jgi:hypothetical protein
MHFLHIPTKLDRGYLTLPSPPPSPLPSPLPTSLPSPPPPPLVVSCSLPPWIVVVLSPVNLQLCDCHPPSPLPPMVGCCVFRLLCHLSLLLSGLSSHCAIPSHSASLVPLVWLVVALPPSRPAGCCITSLHANTSHLHSPLPLIALLPLIMPLSVPLLSLRHCLWQ